MRLALAVVNQLLCYLKQWAETFEEYRGKKSDHHHHPRCFLKKMFWLSSVGELRVRTERSSPWAVSYDGLVVEAARRVVGQVN